MIKKSYIVIAMVNGVEKSFKFKDYATMMASSDQLQGLTYTVYNSTDGVNYVKGY